MSSRPVDPDAIPSRNRVVEHASDLSQGFQPLKSDAAK
jgi:hypothetical protein